MQHDAANIILDIVRRLCGRRRKITRDECVTMFDTLQAEAGLDLQDMGSYLPRPISAARAWERMCSGITFVSVCRFADDTWGIRYDQPGSMNPMQMAEVSIIADTGHRDDGYIRRHCKRLIYVRGEPSVDAPPPPPPPPWWVAELRRHPDVDGVWVRVHDDGVLEMRDPNSGQSSDASTKSRYQYRAGRRGIERRHLPAECVGDRWADAGEPEWEPCNVNPQGSSVIAGLARLAYE